MSNIGGEKRESVQFEEKDFPKKVGLFEAKVIAVNPTREEYSDILGRQLSEESKATNYLGTSKDGNSRLRLDFWLEEVRTEMVQRSNTLTMLDVVHGLIVLTTCHHGSKKEIIV